MHKVLGLSEPKVDSIEDHLRYLVKKAQEVVLNKSTEVSNLHMQESQSDISEGLPNFFDECIAGKENRLPARKL